ncbi:MAG: flavin reductase family protein [Burkholderiaceae bacterium]|nr:flavin reductase family protein [Burkholderiaceae bacterium]
MVEHPLRTGQEMKHVLLDGRHDSRQLRGALGRFPTGVTVITTRTPAGKLEGLTANSFSALSLDPPLVLWSINRKSLSLSGFLSSQNFVINVLRAEQSDVSHRFATARENKFEGVAFSHGMGGSPVLDGVLASFECQTESTIEGGDHLLFIGRVQKITYGDGSPLIFNAGRYCTAMLLRAGSAESDLNGIWAGLG